MRSESKDQADFDCRRQLGELIRKERERLGFTQEGFAQRAGIDRSYMGRMELGKNNLTFEKLTAVLRALRANPATFFRDVHLQAVEPSGRRQRLGLKTTLTPLLAPATLNDSQVLGIVVKHERKLAGLTQDELAERAGMRRSYISGLECGNRNPTFYQLMRILKGLEVDLADFFQKFPLHRRKRSPQLNSA